MVRSAPVRRTRIVSGLLLALGLGSAAALASAAETVILVSFDGTTPAQLRDPRLVSLGRMAREGTVAERLVPVFPTNTFPNHVTLATGVAPERHGIVNNVFVDPERGRFSYEGDPSWLQVEPIWSLAASQGVVSASYHWVGSEGAWTSGRGPRHWKPFDSRTRESTKVEQILAWLDLTDPAERPRLVTAWFHGADGEGHRHGPDSDRIGKALVSQDEALGALVAGLEARGLLARTAILVVSDHGMLEVERSVHLESALAGEGIEARLHGGGGFVTLTTASPEMATRAVAVARAEGLEAWRREEAPPEFRLGNPRFGDAVVLCPPGTSVVRGGVAGRVQQALRGARLAYRGGHGYRPDHPAMAGIFLGFGDGIPASQIGSVRAVDVAPTVLALLGLPVPDWMEGSPILPSQEVAP
jgi:predicted AlkP superfamily pyrophosphatase or phosphodiesterase